MSAPLYKNQVAFNISAFFQGNWQNRVHPGGFWTKSGTFFPRRGALSHVCKTPPNRHLAPELTAHCVRAASQTVFSAFEPSKRHQWRPPKSALDGQPYFVQEHTGCTPPCASMSSTTRFWPHCTRFCSLAKPAETRKRTSPRNPAVEDPAYNWQLAVCYATAAALLTSRPTKIRRHWCTTGCPDPKLASPDATALTATL